jgi:hypothetical protein
VDADVNALYDAALATARLHSQFNLKVCEAACVGCEVLMGMDAHATA